MKALSGLLIVLTLAGAPVLADPPTSSAPLAAPATTTDGKTAVEGLTIRGKLPSGKRCGETDKACLTVAAKEIWDKYPHEIALYCEKERMRRSSDRVNKEAMFGDTPGVETNINSHLPTALEVVCSYKSTPPVADKPAN